MLDSHSILRNYMASVEVYSLFKFQVYHYFFFKFFIALNYIQLHVAKHNELCYSAILILIYPILLHLYLTHITTYTCYEVVHWKSRVQQPQFLQLGGERQTNIEFLYIFIKKNPRQLKHNVNFCQQIQLTFVRNNIAKKY